MMYRCCLSEHSFVLGLPTICNTINLYKPFFSFNLSSINDTPKKPDLITLVNQFGVIILTILIIFHNIMAYSCLQTGSIFLVEL